ncbi:Dihydrolipoamide acyltransferase [Giardia duodenalis assemblage B]|uniref:Dihydrolipoamide acyltransferase n=2 Tax=Giardia intestinalis TaxID=5741 RepID=A0A132NTJ7_GIAIN|nr:Dihydrolipoamide acyltransferase [Giardia intestinalis]KWX12992.1 Dihydrolipoamide acyltransferase [Giardia intestinalis assemblage B]
MQSRAQIIYERMFSDNLPNRAILSSGTGPKSVADWGNTSMIFLAKTLGGNCSIKFIAIPASSKKSVSFVGYDINAIIYCLL